MKHHYAIGILVAALTCASSAQNAAHGEPQPTLIPDGQIQSAPFDRDAEATETQNATYILPAIAEAGGPVYVVPGVVTGDDTISLMGASGMVCLRAGYCTNAAGITLAGSAAQAGTTSTFRATIGASRGTWNFGALLMSIEGVGTVQVFQATGTNGLGSDSPPTTFSLTQSASGLPEVWSYRSLGFPKFKVQNARITFFVADDYYADNSGDFLLSRITPTLMYNADTTKKIVQVLGPCDWAAWDFKPATKNEKSTWGPCKPTAASRDPSQILGEDLGYSFDDPTTGNLIFLFGDAIGVQIPTGDTLVPNSPECPPATSPPTAQASQCFPNLEAHDAIAVAPPTSTPQDFHLHFLSVPGTGDGVPDQPLFVKPSKQPDKIPVSMGAFDVPNSGINVDGTNYILVKTGHDATTGDEFAYSVLVQYDPSPSIAKPFLSGRTISTAHITELNCVFHKCAPLNFQDGHFVFPVPHELPLAYAQQLGLSEPGVLLFGNGLGRDESIYLSYIPASQFWSGKDDSRNPSTQYFIGLDATGQPKWTTDELCAVPVGYDNPTGLPASPGCIVQVPGAAEPVDPGTAGNVSVSYNAALSLWLMTWDGGRQSPTPEVPQPEGIYFSYASEPWGPWSTPQQVYNPCEAASYHQGLGNFIRYPTANASNPCPTATSKMGPQGPIIGAGPDPFFAGKSSGGNVTSRRGAVYAPFQIERFATVGDDGVLSIYFNMSTWNPYTVVLMESDYTIALPF